MARYVKGLDFKLYILDQDEYKIAACLTDCEFSITQGTIPVTSRSTGFWEFHEYTTKSWQGTATGVFFIQRVNGGITPFEITQSIVDEFRTFQIRFRIYDREGYGKDVEGDMIIPRMSYQGGTDDFAVFSIEMKGTGPLLIYDYLNTCALIDSNGDMLIDSNGDILVDNCALTFGEFDPADFSDADFVI